VTIGGVAYSKKNTFTDSAEVNITEDVATAETDKEVDLVMDVSEIAALYINSTQDVLLEVNDGAGTGGSISLVADVPYVWHSSSYHTNLLGTDITAIFITNASGSTATIDMHFVYDATP
jgi:hypothetical protein